MTSIFLIFLSGFLDITLANNANNVGFISLKIYLDGFEEEIQPGEEVIFIGGTGSSRITVADWANLKGTHPYEVLCAIGPRVNRVYITKKGS